MALSAITRNSIALSLLVVGFLAFQLAGEFAKPLPDIPWQTSLLFLAVVLFLFGAASFFAFRGGFYIRTALATAVPIITQALLEMTMGSDPAYPGLTLLLAIPFAVLFFLGSVLIGGPILVWQHFRHQSHLTPQSRADGP